MDKPDAPRYRSALLEMTPSKFRKAGRQLVERIAACLCTLPERSVAPNESPRVVREALGSGSLPAQGAEARVSPPQDAADGRRPAQVTASADDLLLIEQLRGGNEAAFVSLLEHYHPVMLRLALIYVTERTVAEEVVLQTWRTVLEGLDQFKEHFCLKTLLFRTLIHCATSRAQREGRGLPFSSLPGDSALTEPTVDAARFWPADHRWAGQWTAFPSDWGDIPEERLLSQETRACLDRAIEALPPGQRVILLLRDVAGWASDETCCSLGISEATERVLLHHARSQVRGALEKHF